VLVRCIPRCIPSLTKCPICRVVRNHPCPFGVGPQESKLGNRPSRESHTWWMMALCRCRCESDRSGRPATLASCSDRGRPCTAWASKWESSRLKWCNPRRRSSGSPRGELHLLAGAGRACRTEAEPEGEAGGRHARARRGGVRLQRGAPGASSPRWSCHLGGPGRAPSTRTRGSGG
jgi:hypothetical protein